LLGVSPPRPRRTGQWRPIGAHWRLHWRPKKESICGRSARGRHSRTFLWAPTPQLRPLSLTNATAFSPTDAMPLTRTAKVLMAAESELSLVTVLLVAERTLNILCLVPPQLAVGLDLT
jgi:hypothetical protein